MRLLTVFIFSLTLLLTIHSGKTNYEEGIPTPTSDYFIDQGYTIKIISTDGYSSCSKDGGTTVTIINVNNDCNSQTKIFKYIGQNIESSGGACDRMEGKILKSVKKDCIKEFGEVGTLPSSTESTNARCGCGTSNSTEADNLASGSSHGKRSLSFVNNSSTTEYITCSGKNKPHYAGMCLLIALLIHSYYKSRTSGGS